MTGKLRPQIMAAIICGTMFGIFGMYIGLRMEATEIVTGQRGNSDWVSRLIWVFLDRL